MIELALNRGGNLSVLPRHGWTAVPTVIFDEVPLLGSSAVHERDSSFPQLRVTRQNAIIPVFRTASRMCFVEKCREMLKA